MIFQSVFFSLSSQYDEVELVSFVQLKTRQTRQTKFNILLLEGTGESGYR